MENRVRTFKTEVVTAAGGGGRKGPLCTGGHWGHERILSPHLISEAEVLDNVKVDHKASEVGDEEEDLALEWEREPVLRRVDRRRGRKR